MDCRQEKTAEQFRLEANEAFHKKKYAQACELYTKAIEISPSAVLYANRSLARIKLEASFCGLDRRRTNRKCVFGGCEYSRNMDMLIWMPVKVSNGILVIPKDIIDVQ